MIKKQREFFFRMFSKQITTKWNRWTQPIRDVIQPRPWLRFCLLVAEGAVLSEMVIAFKHYRLVGWNEPKGYTRIESQRYGMLGIIPGGRLNGAYTPAPFWRPEVGTIRCDYGPDPFAEYTALHEAGHSQHPWRILYTLCFMTFELPVRFVGILSGHLMVMVSAWCCTAVSERLADLNALQHCRKEALEAAAQIFQQQSLQHPRYNFPPDTHASDGQRHFLIERRIRQLEQNPTAQPKDLPLEIPTLVLFGVEMVRQITHS